MSLFVQKRRDVQDLYIELEEWKLEQWKTVARYIENE